MNEFGYTPQDEQETNLPPELQPEKQAGFFAGLFGDQLPAGLESSALAVVKALQKKTATT